jgi:hypothetical protein
MLGDRRLRNDKIVGGLGKTAKLDNARENPESG